MGRRLPYCLACGRPLRHRARITQRWDDLPGEPEAGICGSCVHDGRAEMLLGLDRGWLQDETLWNLLQLAHSNGRLVVAGPAFWRLVDRLGQRARCACWVCGARYRRQPSRVGHVAGRVVGTLRWALVYGRCSADMGGWTCDGTVHTRADRAMVLRAAIRHERAGGNRRSEYDR